METLLHQLGLSRLVERFHAEDVDDALFWTLGEADLKELGLTLGQRKKLMAAIRAAGPAAGLTDTLPDGFEMRRLTVLFVDMIGSTRLAERLSPDEMNDLFQSFYLAAGAVARRFGGYVASLQGDGVIMLFGYPRTRLGDAERALGAALAMQTDLAAREYTLPSGRKVEVSYRIGVATGPAVVGRPSEAVAGDGLHMVGQVMHRAARLQTVSPPQGVMVDGATRAEVGGMFRFEERPGVTLKGFENSEGLGLLLGPARDEGATRAILQAKPVRTLGRDGERAALAQAWAEVEQGACRTVTITGGAGQGKSALLRAFLADLNEVSARIIWMSCRALSQNSALAPVIGMFDQLIGDPEAATPLARLDALRHVTGGLSDAQLQPLMRLLALDEAQGPRRDTPHGQSAAAQRGELIGLLADWLVSVPGNQPVIVALEDAHWCDATTREMLARCAERAVGRPVLLLATSRNRDEALWAGDPSHLSLGLGALDGDAAAALLEDRLDGHRLPAAIRRRILQLSEGNPLMLETLARAFGQDRVGDLGRDVSVPQTIYESLSERLETLGAGRPVAAALAVLDAEADRDLLARMLGQAAGQVDHGIQELLDAGIVAPLEDGDRVHFFHHLYRDVVYERLVGADRRDLHRRALVALQDHSLDMGARRPDVLATHAAAAGAPAQAAPLALNAGERFLSGSALVEANHYLEMAQEALRALPQSDEQKRLRLRVLTGLAAVKRGRLSIAHDEVGALGQEILALARDLGDNRAEMLALNGLYAHALVRADYRAAHDWAEALIDAAEAGQDRVFAMIGQRALGVVALHVGRFEAAETGLRAALAAYDRDRDLHLAYAHGYDHAEICAVFLAFALWMRGDLQGARDMSAFSVAHSREIDHAHSLGQAQAFRAMLAAMALDDGELSLAADEALETADRFDIKVARGAGLFFGGAARLLAGHEVPDAARLRELDASFDAFREFNPYNYGAFARSLLAMARLRAGDPVAANACLQLAREVEQRTGEVWTRSELERLSAQVCRAQGKVTDADHIAQEAYVRAEAGGAVTLALRLACDLAEARGTAADLRRLETAAARIVSDDDGWDMRRYKALSRAASAGTRASSASK